LIHAHWSVFHVSDHVKPGFSGLRDVQITWVLRFSDTLLGYLAGVSRMVSCIYVYVFCLHSNSPANQNFGTEINHSPSICHHFRSWMVKSQVKSSQKSQNHFCFAV